MDRDSIQRRDFPVGRRGYDPVAVDAHLRTVADELERLRDQPAAAPRALSAGTSEQVRLILEAAERSAAELKEQAGRDAGEHVAKVEEATGEMLGRLGALHTELDGLLASLRRSGELLEQGLARLREDVATVGGDVAPEPPVVAPDSPDGEPDEAGARLIALNMALSGTPRDETAAYLAEHYALADADALLDDVYKRAGT